ncbi:MAG: phosphoglycerate mutase family protein [Bdellovibrionales bacterium]
MTKTLVLCRHAHRDNTKRELDNGLTDKGREQAKNIKRFFADRFQAEDLKRGLWFVSSPKLRCMETLLPTAKACDRPVDAHPDLDEQSSKEGTAGLETRVKRFLNEWSSSKVGITVLCSHGDWLPLATFQLLGTYHDFKKGSWLEIEWVSGKAYLKWYVPTFRPFYK